MRDQAEPFTRLFDRFDLMPFDIDGTRQLIEKPLQIERIPWRWMIPSSILSMR